MDNPQNVISFCTGYGGLELGIGRAGVDVRIICNVEIEAFVQANLVAKIEEGRMADAEFIDLCKEVVHHQGYRTYKPTEKTANT